MKSSKIAKGKDTKTVKVRILEKEVQIACAPGDEDDLMKAARYVDESMRDFRERSNTSTVEKIAIITAISTANELLKSRSGSPATEDLSNDLIDDSIQERIEAMQARLDSVLED